MVSLQISEGIAHEPSFQEVNVLSIGCLSLLLQIGDSGLVVLGFGEVGGR